jgi:hypothetical protein
MGETAVTTCLQGGSTRRVERGGEGFGDGGHVRCGCGTDVAQSGLEPGERHLDRMAGGAWGGRQQLQARLDRQAGSQPAVGGDAPGARLAVRLVRRAN